MIEESIKAVKAAEEKAEAMLADARKEADAIIVKAKADAEQLVKDAGENGKTSAAEEMERARIAGEAVLAEAEKEAAKDVEALKAVTEGKVSDAIVAVMERLGLDSCQTMLTLSRMPDRVSDTQISS